MVGRDGSSQVLRRPVSFLAIACHTYRFTAFPSSEPDMLGRRVFPLILTAALTLAPMGCASGGGGGDDGSVDNRESLYREDVGRVLFQPLEAARMKIWGKHNIPMLRDDHSGRGLLWESEWIRRPPTSGELATAGRNRVVLRGYQTGENLDGTGVYRVTFEVENQVLTDGAPDWHPAPFPKEVKETFQRLYSDLMMEVRAGVRR